MHALMFSNEVCINMRQYVPILISFVRKSKMRQLLFLIISSFVVGLLIAVCAYIFLLNFYNVRMLLLSVNNFEEVTFLCTDNNTK